jgi:hypothetical protein
LIGLLLDSDGFTRQHGFVDSERDSLNQPQVGRHDVALRKQHDVAWHDLSGRHDALFARP